MDFLGDNDNDDISFKINQNYAKRYDTWRKGEELQKLKDKYGDNPEDSSSTSEDEDDDAKELTEEIEKQFFQTLSCLKDKNPLIYNKDYKFFSDIKREGTITNKSKKKEAPLTVAAYSRKLILENSDFNDEEEFKKFSNVEQEKAIKESFKDVLKSDTEDENEEGWGGLLKKRDKTEEELNNEEKNYRVWLSGEKESLGNKDEEKQLKGLHDYWINPALDENEQFLRNYILNRRFIDDTKEDKDVEEKNDSDGDLSEEEETLKKQEEFEHKFNFRFEEPDQEFIKRYPRTMENSLRKKDERRSKHREDVKERKKVERSKKDEELKRLKALKKSEIMDKIKKLQEITGNTDMGFKNKDVEEDFDPAEHDRRMNELFNTDYYGDAAEEKKPECPPELEEELELENWDEWDGKEQNEDLHCEDPGFNMDCDYDPSSSKQNHQQELIRNTKGKRNKRRQTRFAAAVNKPKPVFDPSDKSFDQYLEEYYALDYEDLIGDIPCRFKYRKVVPNDYGLDIDEILAAPDRELNSWSSVKKIMQRRPDNVEIFEVQAYKKKAQNFEKKKKCLPSLYDPKPPRESLKVKKESNKKKQSQNDVSNTSSMVETEETLFSSGTIKKKKKQKGYEVNQEETTNQKKKKRKLQNQDDSPPKVKKQKMEIVSIEPKKENHEDKQKIKKKKKKQNQGDTCSQPKTKKQHLQNGSTEPQGTALTRRQRKNLKLKKQKSVNPSNNNHVQDKKKKKHQGVIPDLEKKKNILLQLSDERLRSYGLNPKKFKNKIKYADN